MAKPEWGLKRTCLSCSDRFYDMQRDPIVCPKCGTEFDPLALVRPRRARAAAASQAKAKAPAPVAEETAETEDAAELVDDLDEDIDLEEDDADDVIADADDLDDDDEVPVVIEKTKEDDT